ncbi:MAG TPA: plasmid pRiA4b ORF-3 family protein [Acidimicrobiales bacterium]|nr:plasmid pRiA4b ORF-3 family protein [Acidimicrobiales bacterium]
MTAPTPIQIKVSLGGAHPPIWRRLVVAGDTSLDLFHVVLQVAMGWEDAHLHCFRIAGVRYGPADDDFGDDVDEATVTIAETLGAHGRGEYLYDFGDSWEHELLVEKATEPVELDGLATCLGGKGACPPEDCGGIWGYAQMLEVLADPTHEDHEDAVEWLGDEFDPDAFDLAAINARFARARSQDH